MRLFKAKAEGTNIRRDQVGDFTHIGDRNLRVWLPDYGAIAWWKVRWSMSKAAMTEAPYRVRVCVELWHNCTSANGELIKGVAFRGVY